MYGDAAADLYIQIGRIQMGSVSMVDNSRAFRKRNAGNVISFDLNFLARRYASGPRRVGFVLRRLLPRGDV